MFEKGYLNLRRMNFIYSLYLKSSDSRYCDFDVWLKRNTEFSEYQIRRLLKFRISKLLGEMYDYNLRD